MKRAYTWGLWALAISACTVAFAQPPAEGQPEAPPAAEAAPPKEPAPKEKTPKEPAPKEPAPKEPAPKEPAPKEPAPKEPAPKEKAPKEPAPKKKTPPEKEPDTLREQTIYVPYSKLQKVFERQGRGVFLPYDEFQKLWTQAREAMREKPDQPPPVAALLTEIDSEASVGDQVVNVTARLKVEILRKGWHEVPLRLADASIQSARFGDQPARLLLKPRTGYWLLIHKEDDQPEQRELTLQYSKTFTKAPGQNSVAFQAPQAPVNQWKVRIPQEGVKVNIQPLVAATEPPAPAEGQPPPTETVLMAFVGAAESLRIDWTPKTEGATGLAALATVEAQQQVAVEEGVVKTTASLTYKISRAELSQLTIEVPADHRVLNVFDSNVREWTVEQAENVNRILVQLYEPARETQRVAIELEKFSDDMAQDGVQVPVIRAMDVGRQQGTVMVSVSPSLRAEVASRSGLLQLDTSELPKSPGGQAWDFAYRYAALPFELSLSAEKVEPEIRTRELVEAYLEPEQLTLDLLVIYQIERAGVFQLELDIPAGFEVRRVEGHAAADAQPAAVDTHHAQGDDGTRLIVNLSRKAMGRVGLLVELQRRLDDANLLSPTGETSEIALPLPRVAPDGIEQSIGRLIVYAPESLRVNPSRQEGVQSIAAAEALEGTASTRNGRFGSTREVLAYAYTSEPVDLALAVERRKPYITCGQLLSARIELGVVKYEATFFYNIQYSGVKTLRLDVPAALADQIRNQTPGVARETTIDPQPKDVAKDYVAWNLTGETEFLGNVAIRFFWEHKVAELEVRGTVQEPLPRLVPQGVDLASGEIVLAKAETLDVQPAGDPKGLRPVDPQQDLTLGPPATDAARAFRFEDDARDSWELTVDITRYELVEIKRTSIERAVLRIEVTRSGELSVQALYRVRSARQRLPLELPEEVEFDTDPLRVNGRSTALEQGDPGEYFVPLTGQSPTDPFLLELRYAVPGTHRRLWLPHFPTDPAVQKVYLCAYLPDELALLGARGPWTDEMNWRWYDPQPRPQRSDRELIAWVTEGLNVADPAEDFATDGRLHTFSTIQPAAPPADGALRLIAVNEKVLHGVLFAIVLLIGLLLIRRPLAQKFAAVVLLAAILLLAGVFAPRFARQVLDAALLIAVLIVLAVWSAWYVYRLSRLASDWQRRRAPAAPPAGQPLSAEHAASVVESPAGESPAGSPFASADAVPPDALPPDAPPVSPPAESGPGAGDVPPAAPGKQGDGDHA